MTSALNQGTEAADPRFTNIEQWPTHLVVRRMIDDQIEGLREVNQQVSQIAIVAEAMARRLRFGGRLIYAGAGTSGRIAVQDGVELQPTFGWPINRIDFLIAGGPAALTESVEGAEDDISSADSAIDERKICSADVVICVAASGRTPYTIGIAKAASKSGALTVGISNNSNAELSKCVSYAIEISTGPEVIAGSTRLKAGTAQKGVLNALSTAMMLRLGFVERGMMVSMQVTNEKLFKRAVGIIQTLVEVSAVEAEGLLTQANLDIRKAIALSGSVIKN
jgi:N-acetylmuramic acid 6-phosphate etherase